MARTYAYAVMDGNQAPDQRRFSQSCHVTLAAARRSVARLSRGDANARYYVVDWGARRWACEQPAPEHPRGL